MKHLLRSDIAFRPGKKKAELMIALIAYYQSSNSYREMSGLFYHSVIHGLGLFFFNITSLPNTFSSVSKVLKQDKYKSAGL